MSAGKSPRSPRGATRVGAKDPVPSFFPTDLPELEWVQFSAAGFEEPVCGVIHRTGCPPCCGVPLGGISTGCLDIEASGVLGFNSIFVAHPRSPQLLRPFLGLAVGGRVWVLASQQIIAGGSFPGCNEPRSRALGPTITVPALGDVECAKEIHYWGHYPIADLEYDTDAPVQAGLRAWAPFIPGDAAISNTPAAVFEVHLRNSTASPQRGTLAFSFPGPSQAEAQVSPHSLRQLVPRGQSWFHDEVWEPVAEGTIEARRERVQRDGFRGLSVAAESGVGYFVGVIGEENLRHGGSLEAESHPNWADISSGLPAPEPTDFGTSLAVDFSLQAGEAKTVRLLLTWYAPLWKGKGENCYRQMYASRYRGAVEVAELVARHHDSLLPRILAWQQAVYSARELPVWLRDTLVNNLALIPECAYWAAPGPPVGDWCAPNGLFGLMESPRSCAQIECIPCSWYGNLPIVYFFPELARSTLSAYKQYMRADGAAPFSFGPAAEMADPSWDWQKTLNGACFVDMVDRLWLRTGDDELLREFYPAVKESTTCTMTMRPGPEGVISMPIGNVGREWWEGFDWFGMAAHLGGLHLSNLKIAERMAEKVGDSDFAEQCREWFRQGSAAMEEKVWAGEYYLLYNEPETGKKSDLIMANQLDGEWANRFHGLPGVFQEDRVRATLATVKRTCLVKVCGAAAFASPGGTPDLRSYGIFPPEIIILGMTFLYAGDHQTGVDVVRRNMHNLVCKQRHAWDLPNMIYADTGEREFGTDYYQNMMLWAVPAALAGKDLSAPCVSGGLVHRLLQAGKEP